YIDEEVLSSAGVTDFSRYAVQPGSPLIPDLFVD
ncbi:MAG TPA: short chain dehydrogenase, partial [Casimicrobiaceae bacterium]|nr:short chain dehydrogenase [Casimicrobiaceae bacterium]